MKFYSEVERIIWSNFHVDHLDWIATNFELKFENNPEL
jgi:hypothetical protein